MIDFRVRLIISGTRQWADQKYGRDHGHDLSGFCARASAELFTRLKRAGHEPRLVWNNDHVFVVLYDHILDITASQFGKGRIEIVHVREAKFNWFWRIKYLDDDLNSMIDRLRKQGWAASFTPLPRRRYLRKSA